MAFSEDLPRRAADAIGAHHNRYAMNPDEHDNPLWSYAARTLRSEGSQSDLKQLALRHHREALRQYLTLRLCSEAAAREGLRALATQVAQADADALTADPGPRARLFRMARDYALQHDAAQRGPTSTLLRHGAAADSGLRKLPSQHAELLELRHARELSPVEIAYVLQVGVPEVEQRLSSAEAASKEALHLSSTGGLPLALARTFAVAPDPNDAPAPSDDDPSLPPGTIIGMRYTLEKAVGIGAFGQVYRAADNLVEGHRVALKLLHHPARSEKQRQDALRELRLIASVFHPSIVSFKDHGWHDDRFWFVMPWYDGEPLQDRIERQPLSRAEALQIFTPLANALASMHAAGVRHQDIKPENIFLAELKTDPLGEDQLQPVLLDLGVAATEADSLIAGTPAYFAPEVAAACAGEAFAPIGEAADVFSLALSLRNALEPDTAEEVEGSAIHLFIATRAQRTPGPPADKSLSFLAPHFERWLSHDPDVRPTAAEFASELQVLLAPERKAAKRRAFLGWFVPVMASFFVLAAGGAFAWSQQMREQENRAHAAELHARLSELNAQREAAERARLQVEHGELQEQHAETTRAREQLAGALESSEAEADKLSARASALARARRQTEKALASTEAELGDLTEKAAQLSMTKAQLEGKVDELSGRVQTLLQQAKALDALLDDTRALLKREQAQGEKLRGQLQQAGQQQAALDAQLQRVTREREMLQAQLQETRQVVDQRDKQLKQRDKRLKQLDEELEQRDEKLKQRDKQLTQRDEKLKQRDKQLKQRDDKIAKQQKRIEQLQGSQGAP